MTAWKKEIDWIYDARECEQNRQDSINVLIEWIVEPSVRTMYFHTETNDWTISDMINVIHRPFNAFGRLLTVAWVVWARVCGIFYSFFSGYSHFESAIEVTTNEREKHCYHRFTLVLCGHQRRRQQWKTTQCHVTHLDDRRNYSYFSLVYVSQLSRLAMTTTASKTMQNFFSCLETSSICILPERKVHCCFIGCRLWIVGKRRSLVVHWIISFGKIFNFIECKMSVNEEMKSQ